MKTRTIAVIFAAIALAVPFGVADSTSSPSDSAGLGELRKELQQTKAQLEELAGRTTRLEQQVRTMERSNAQLLQEVRRLLERRPPTWVYPPTNGVPPLTPLRNH